MDWSVGELEMRDFSGSSEISVGSVVLVGIRTPGICVIVRQIYSSQYRRYPPKTSNPPSWFLASVQATS